MLTIEPIMTKTAGILAIGAILAGCSSMGGGSSAPGGPQKTTDALALVNYSTPGYRSTQTYRDSMGNGTASVSGNTLNASLSDNVGGTTTFSVGGGATTNNANGSQTMQFAQGQTWGLAYLGAHSVAYSGGSNSTRDAWALVEGQQTPTAAMPTQQATYTGGWNMFYNDRANQSGQFNAAADFAAGTLGLNFTGDATGTGGGAITGNTFNASFDLSTPITWSSGSTPIPNPYNVRGSFFGPAAEEMGGIISGNVSGAAIYGPDADVPNPANPFPTIFGGTLWGKR